MKRPFVSLLAGLLLMATAQAQYVVYDPTLHIEAITDHAEDVVKFIEMINNQVDQIDKLASQLQEIRHYIDLFGDPSQFTQVVGASGLLADLQEPRSGMTLERLRRLADVELGQTFDADGLYRYLGPTFRTPDGVTMDREGLPYRAFAAIHKTLWNFGNVYTNVMDRRVVLEGQIAASTQQLEAASTDAEVQKLTGVLIGLNTALSAIDREVDQAVGQTVVQDAENRNFKEKYAQARKEEQQAEFTEAMTKFCQTFQLSTEPPAFPEH